MASGDVRWRITGYYFENCNCDVVCPCLFSTAPAMTSPPTNGACKVGFGFHVERGRFGEVALDGLNVALAVRTPGPMADGNWSVALYLEAGGHRAARRPHGHFRGQRRRPGWRTGPTHLDCPGRCHRADHLEERGSPALDRDPRARASSRQGRTFAGPRPGGLGSEGAHLRPGDRDGLGRRRQHLDRVRHALGQLRQERPLRPHQLVKWVGKLPLVPDAYLVELGTMRCPLL